MRNGEVNGDGPVPDTVTRPVSYLDLPKKIQLGSLCLARLMDPLWGSSNHAYIFFQVRYLLPSASIPEVATYVGFLYLSRTAGKVCTGILWGRVADSKWGGRKLVLLIGLVSSSIASIGYGFATSFVAAIFWLIFAGAMSSNVGITRCVAAEINPDKRLRARALLLLASVGNAGLFIGPLIGGLLVSAPQQGPFRKHPFALPNLVVALCYAVAAIGVAVFLEETLEQGSSNGLTLGLLWQKIRDYVSKPRKKKLQRTYSSGSEEAGALLVDDEAAATTAETQPMSQQIPFRQIWTSQVVCTLVAQFIINAHLSTFQMLSAVFLSTPVDRDPDFHRSPLRFGGGVGLNPVSIGVVMSSLNGVGVLLQLVVYPWFNDRWSTVQIWHVALMIFPFTYFFAPYPALVASSTPESTDGTPVGVWLTIAGVLTLNVIGRTGAVPGMAILINECVPGPSARATINTAATTSGQLSKSMFPVVILAMYGWGVEQHIVGLAFWTLSALAVVAIIASRWVGSGSSTSKSGIRLPGGSA